MKRFWSTSAFTTAQSIRAHQLERRRLSPRTGSSRPPSPRTTTREVNLPAPEILKLFDNTSETLHYCNLLRAHLARRDTDVVLDFRPVGEFTSDALLLIRSLLYHIPTIATVRVHAILPRRPGVATEFKASGFFSGFTKPPNDLPPAKGLMHAWSEDMVYSKVAADMVRFAEKHTTITKDSANACSQTLVELMTNTHNHAWYPTHSIQDRHETWFASVYCRGGVAYFNFLDLGIGVLKSAPARSFTRQIQKTGILPAYGGPHLLRDTFLGKVGSATNKPGRGLGLPRMKYDADRDRLSTLHILTSNVVGSVVTLDFRTLKQYLRGTVFHWRARSHRGAL